MFRNQALLSSDGEWYPEAVTRINARVCRWCDLIPTRAAWYWLKNRFKRRPRLHVHQPVRHGLYQPVTRIQ